MHSETQIPRNRVDGTQVKKGDRQQDNNYRPITSLITVDKIFEQILCKQVTDHYD